MNHGTFRSKSLMYRTTCLHVSLPVSTFVPKNILFLETRKNIIIDGDFTKLIYSDETSVFNAIYLCTPIHSCNGNASSNFVTFSLTNPHNMEVIKALTKIETEILSTYQMQAGCTKGWSMMLSSQLQRGQFKVYQTNPFPSLPKRGCSTDEPVTTSYILKISGIWETQQQIGITFKFIV